MAIDLHPDVVRAINEFANTKLGRRYGKWAQKNYGIGGKRLMAKTTAGEFGGASTKSGRGKVSSAGARGPAQFIPSTRSGYIKQHGVDPWKNDKSAFKGMALHHLGTGVAGYNPNMSTYTSYIMGQDVNEADMKALRTGRGRGAPAGGGTPRRPGSPAPTEVKRQKYTIPGQSFEAERSEARRGLLMGGDLDMKKLLRYKAQVNQLQDVPDQQVVGDIQDSARPPAPARGGGGGPGAKGPKGRGPARAARYAARANKMDRQQQPYVWGGGHGATPDPNGPWDCSGAVSQVIGVSPRVSGQFEAWGKPGKGKHVTVYANGGHVFMSINGKYFGTSKSNPKGGAGWFPTSQLSASYLRGFTARHPG